MALDNEKFVRDLKKGIESKILSVLAKHNENIEAYRFYVEVWEVDPSHGGLLLDKKVLLDDRYGHCRFCGKPTLYYDEENGFYLCPECYAKLNSQKVKQ